MVPRGVRPRLQGKQRTPLSSRVTTRISWCPLSASRESSLLFTFERGLVITLQARQEKKALTSRGGAISGVSSSCGTRGGFLPRHDEDLREPLVRFQGSHVSMHMARRSASLFSSHGRGLGPRDALKKDSRCLSWVAAGNPRFPRLLPGTFGNFPGCL